MMLPLEIPPGVWRTGTDMQSTGRWRDTSLVRWENGSLRPVGGWRQLGSGNANAAPRGAIAWVDNAGDTNLACGTYNKLYYVSATGTFTDITPAGLTAGLEDSSQNTGFGGGLFGAGTFGTPRAETGTYTPVTTWTLDTWGEYLVACSIDDGKLYEWQLSSTAAAISGAPTSCRGLVVTEERFLFALGAGGNPRKVQWCDREDNTTWTPSATNEAGDFELQTSGQLMRGLRVRGETLLLTSTDAHSAQYIGPDFVYRFERAGDACGLVAPLAACVANDTAYWMGNESFFMYAGGSVEAMPCDVADFVFANVNRNQISKSHAFSNARFNEVWFVFPSAESNECDKYVFYDYKERHWGIGAIDRTAGVDSGAANYPVWFKDDGVPYQHEVGYNHDSDDVYAESGPISLGVGENTYTVTELIPDEQNQGDVTMKFKARFYPNDTEREYGSFSMTSPTSVLFTGRQVRARVDSASNDSWRVGVNRLRVQQRGKR